MEKHGKILIVDDNEDILFALNLLLKPHVEQIRVITQPDRIEDFINTFTPDLIILDMNFRCDASSGDEGIFWLKKIKNIDPQAVVVCMTAYSDTDKAVRAIKAGAVDFIQKPWENDKLLATVSSALQLRDKRLEVEELKKQVAAFTTEKEAPQIIAQSKAMCDLLETVEKLKDTDANILILGENGTGKDFIAHLLYQHSPRAKMPFVQIDLGSIPEQLFESELFGYEKGAFTDAKKEKQGRIELASGGTLFFDEIGNLSLPMQAKLLTAIEKRIISRLGSTRVMPIDVRWICATNADILQMVNNNTFRQDLLYRINTIELHIPPLRERGEDVILLAEYFAKRFGKKYKKEIKGITREAQRKLLQYPWPGNVRELQHTIERAIILSKGFLLNADDFILQPANPKRKDNKYTLNLEELEKTAIEQALKQADGNISQAADLLGITRYALYRKMAKYE